MHQKLRHKYALGTTLVGLPGLSFGFHQKTGQRSGSGGIPPLLRDRFFGNDRFYFVLVTGYANKIQGIITEEPDFLGAFRGQPGNLFAGRGGGGDIHPHQRDIPTVALRAADLAQMAKARH